MSLYSSDCGCPLDSDEEKRNRPHSEWCGECQQSCCVNCYESKHTTCDKDTNEVTLALNKFQEDPEANESEMDKIKNNSIKEKMKDIKKNRKDGISYPL